MPSRVGHPYRKVSPQNLAYWLGSSRRSVTESPPAYPQECARPRALGPPTPDEALRAIAERTRTVSAPQYNHSSQWEPPQRVLLQQVRILLSGGTTFEVQPESWAAVTEVWQWLIGGGHNDDAARLLTNLQLKDNRDFELQLAAANPVESSR